MSTSTKPRLRTIQDLDALDAATVSFAKEQQVPLTIHPAETTNPGTDGEGGGATIAPAVASIAEPPKANVVRQSPSRRIHINVPLYAIRELKDRATKDDTTMRYIVLTALRASGIKIKDVDMIEDGRRVSE